MIEEKTKIITDRIKQKFILECENEDCGAILVGDSVQEVLHLFQHGGWQYLTKPNGIFCRKCAESVSSWENVLEKRRRLLK